MALYDPPPVGVILRPLSNALFNLNLIFFIYITNIKQNIKQQHLTYNLGNQLNNRIQ